jgi:exonuclease SbcD
MKKSLLRVLHTSDWHLGRTLYGRHRYEEFAAFLDWLYETIVSRRIDLLLVAGDIFHTATPNNHAQQLYYTFLCRVAASCCRHLVVIGGNHDSPTFLSAPRELLRALDIHVVAALPESPADEVLVLKDAGGTVEAIVCAVPFLRDREVRRGSPGQSMEDREEQLVVGIADHYRQVCEEAAKELDKLAEPVPVIGTGHLFTSGGRVEDGDGVRSLYVGSLASVGAAVFPDLLDYVALGHLHSPQKVAGKETIRYSGAPLCMGFAEAGRSKSVCLAAFFPDKVEVEQLPIPVFQEIRSIQGDLPHIEAVIQDCIKEEKCIWLEIIYQGTELVSDLRQRLTAAVEGSQLEILRIRNQRIVEQALRPAAEDETLAELGHERVFERCLAAHTIPTEQRQTLLQTYNEIVTVLQQDDSLAG